MKEGDFVEIDYLSKNKNTGKYFDVTNEEKAKEYGLYEKNRIYKPVKVIVGARHVIEGLDMALLEMEIGEERVIGVSPDLGFGKRDPKLVTTVPMREFSRQGVMPRPGLSMDIGGKWATVKSVSSGRVTIDFNHSLAGRTLEYTVKILSVIEGTENKLKALLELHMGYYNPKTTITIEGGKAVLKVPGIKKELEEAIRAILKEEVGKYFPELEEVEFSS